ncbi:MAG: prepilin-type N-terminal cleavage/methylation domain-containing protein [candidate division WOR-3 bacterium]|nr:prepilin-type N-terminal cleavage/methylation domain-containing protein [candidate division WOR-3 bacterium]MDW8113895.1 prepilin-type N-terminal cleavage/methylation domain-containing protein [candidate division WOR-3 bacterium]
MIMKKSSGVTLLEMIVVMVIIGILAGISLSAIDRIRERSQIDETMEELKRIGKAITGDPELIVDGKRIDFGYVGDMGKLPDSLGALINNEGGLWRGPYLKLNFSEDKESYKIDAWGRYYQYTPEDLSIRSFANGRFTLTYKIAESYDELFNNKIYGYIYDNEKNPPGNKAAEFRVSCEYPRNGERVYVESIPKEDGFFSFDNIPIGTHLVKVYSSRETLQKYVTVLPRSQVFIEFKIPRIFRGGLVYVANSANSFPSPFDTVSNNFSFELFNPTTETIRINSLNLLSLSTDRVFYEIVTIDNDTIANFGGGMRFKVNQNVNFDSIVAFGPYSKRIVSLLGFYNDSIGGNSISVKNKLVKIRTSDGSVNQFLIP